MPRLRPPREPPSLTRSPMSLLCRTTFATPLATARVAKRTTVNRAVVCAADKTEQLGKAAAAVVLSAVIGLTVVDAAQADVAGLTPCSQSKAFAKRKKQEVKALNKRLKNYEEGSAPALALKATIEKTEKRIELLREKRTSLINQVVTKGLNPDVEMKDSGVEWIGEIPSHWDTIRGKYILKILTGNYPSEIVEDEEGQYFVKVDDLNSMENKYYLSNPKSKIEGFGVETLEKGIILFPKRGMTIFTNKVVITKSRCFIDPNLM